MSVTKTTMCIQMPPFLQLIVSFWGTGTICSSRVSSHTNSLPFTMVKNSQESPCQCGSGSWSIFLYIKRLGDSIPSQGTYLGCRFTLGCGVHRRQLINVSASLFLSLSPPLLKHVYVKHVYV